MRDTVLNNTIVTFCVCLLVATLAAKGNLLATMLSFPIDFLGLLALLLLSWLVSIVAILHLERGQWKESILMYLMLYYLAFGIFADGNIKGIEHSVGAIEKLKMTLVHIAVSVPSIYIPIIIFGISVIHLLFLRAHLVDVDRSVCKKAIYRK
ncbi:hypothetical protein J4N37_09560 [Vibrio sp. SCSIO 43153]|uniref:hypothetical protein n=1 Tax=Vibrio sp. SCSIO 43153 TaxID=2819098 RepID=UPI0020760CFB|nr:hypothetical protein [Vibrio sp. SCSIO 43153]USD48867.1 hypothetical protein J4N37_09560 [Vibrio sp. SCSIO 43153]